MNPEAIKELLMSAERFIRNKVENYTEFPAHSLTVRTRSGHVYELELLMSVGHGALHGDIKRGGANSARIVSISLDAIESIYWVRMQEGSRPFRLYWGQPA